MHKVFAGKGHESIDLSNSSKIPQKHRLPAKTEIYPKVLGGNFSFIFNFQFQFQSHARKKFR